MADLSEFQSSSADWRSQLKKNERKTKAVLFIFIAIYTLIGLLVDMYALISMHHHLPLSTAFYMLVSLQVVPFATILLFLIAILSILITYAMYDRIMLMGTNHHEITPQSTLLEEKQLYNVVEEMKVAAGLKYMPKVFLIEAEYMNAFASGYSEKSAMVAITRGLMQKLNRAELQAVMAHELSHIRHHDIKLTLMVAVLSNIILIVMDILFYSIVFKNNRRENNQFVVIIILLRYLLPFLTIILTLFLNRTREFMADSGAVELMRDNEPLAKALLKIQEDHVINQQSYTQAYGLTPHEQVRHAAYLFDPSNIDPVRSLNNAFSTHPSMVERLKAIGYKLIQRKP